MLTATVIFVISGLCYAFVIQPVSRPITPDFTLLPTQGGLLLQPVPDPPSRTEGLAVGKGWLPDQIIRPSSPILLILMGFVHMSVLIRGVRMVSDSRPAVAASPQRRLATWFAAAIDTTRRGLAAMPNPDARNAPMVLALLISATWPWMALSGGIYAATALAFLAMTLALSAAIRGVHRKDTMRYSISTGIFAGWTVVLAFAALMAVLMKDFGLSAVSAATVCGILATATVGVAQALAGGLPSMVVTVMVALVAAALATMQSAPALATLSVLALAALGVVLIRETS